MNAFWETAVSVAGLGGISAFVFWSLYKEWLKLPIFQRLKKDHLFALFKLFLILTFLFGIAALVSYVVVNKTKSSSQPNFNTTINGNISSNGNAVIFNGQFQSGVSVNTGISTKEFEAALNRYRTELKTEIAHAANAEGMLSARQALFEKYIDELIKSPPPTTNNLQDAQNELQQYLQNEASHVPISLKDADLAQAGKTARQVADLLDVHQNYRSSLPLHQLAALISPLDPENWNSLGLSYEKNDEFLKSIKSYLLAINLTTFPKSIPYEANLANVYRRLHLLEKADFLLTSIIDYYDKNSDTNDLDKLYGSLAGVKLEESNYVAANDLLEKSLRIQQQLNDTPSIIITYFNLCGLSLSMEDYNNAEIRLAKLKALIRESGLQAELENAGGVFFLSALIESNEGKTSQAIDDFVDAGTFEEKRGNDIRASVAFCNAGDLLLRIGDEKRASAVLMRAKNLATNYPQSDVLGDIEYLQKHTTNVVKERKISNLGNNSSFSKQW